MDEAKATANDDSAEEKLESDLLGLALKLTAEFEPWAEQDRAVYTSEVMERELERLFPVDTFLERKKFRE